MKSTTILTQRFLLLFRPAGKTLRYLDPVDLIWCVAHIASKLCEIGLHFILLKYQEYKKAAPGMDLRVVKREGRK